MMFQMRWALVRGILLVGFCTLLRSGGCGQMVANQFLRPRIESERKDVLLAERRRVQREWGNYCHDFSWLGTDGFHMRAMILTPREAPEVLAPAATLPEDSRAEGGRRSNLLERLLGLRRVKLPETPPRGLIVLLHGLSDRKEGMLANAEWFARHGYVAVSVDLRAHGQSQGRYTTFGRRERWDMVALLNNLQLDGFDTSHVGAMGTSLGAATALQWAAVDERVKAVVAIAPFASLNEEVAHLNAIQARQVSPFVLHVLEWAAEAAAEFRINEVSPLQAIAHRRVPVYLIHGNDDQVIPAEQSDQLFAAAAGPAVLEHVPGAGHHDVWWKLGTGLLMRATDWMECYVVHDGESAPHWVGHFENRNMSVTLLTR